MHIIFNSRKQWREKAFALNLPLKCKRLGNSIPEQFFLKQSWQCLLENVCGLIGWIQLGWSSVYMFDFMIEENSSCCCHWIFFLINSIANRDIKNNHLYRD